MCDNDLPLIVINRIWELNNETLVYAVQAVANLDIYLQETFGANKKFRWYGTDLIDERNSSEIEVYSVLEDGSLNYEADVTSTIYSLY